MFKSPTTTMNMGYGGYIIQPRTDTKTELRFEMYTGDDGEPADELPFYNPESYHYNVPTYKIGTRTHREEKWNDGENEIVHMDKTPQIYYRGFVSDREFDMIPMVWLQAPYFTFDFPNGSPYTSDIIGNEITAHNSPFISVSKNINTAVNFIYFRQGRRQNENYGYIFIIRSARAFPITNLKPNHRRIFNTDDKLHTFGNSPWDEELIPVEIGLNELVGWIKINLVELRHPESVAYPDISPIHWYNDGNLDNDTIEKIERDYAKVPKQIAKIRALHVTPFTDIPVVPDDNKPPPLGGEISPTKGGRIKKNKYYTYYSK